MSKFEVLVPVKALAQAKKRLQARLDAPARADLMCAMVEQVLAAAAGATQVRAAYVVTLDPRVRELARKSGAQILPDDGQGLNSALAAAVSLRRSAGAEAIALVQGDLPCLTGADLDRFLASVPHPAGGAIVPDQTGEGTSALAWRGPKTPRLAFGAGSLQRHIELAQEDGLTLVVHPPQPPFYDVDDIADLVAVSNFDRAGCVLDRIALDGAPQ